MYNITNLAINTAITAVENKIHNVCNLVTKSDHKRKVSETENNIAIDYDNDKNTATQKFNKLTTGNFPARLAQKNLASKNDFADFIKKRDFDDKLKKLNKNVTSNKTKHGHVEYELN